MNVDVGVLVGCGVLVGTGVLVGNGVNVSVGIGVFVGDGRSVAVLIGSSGTAVAGALLAAGGRVDVGRLVGAAAALVGNALGCSVSSACAISVGATFAIWVMAACSFPDCATAVRVALTALAMEVGALGSEPTSAMLAV